MMRSFFFAAVFAGALAFPATSKGAVLLLIDTSDFSAITFTSTGASASTTTTSTQFRDGVVLSGFFKSAPDSALFNLTGSLTTPPHAGEVPTYTRLAGSSASSGSYIDINFYVNSGHPQATVAQRFYSGSTAFSGEVTINMEHLADYLIGEGTGNIYAGYSNLVLIGQWQAIPEPAVWKTGLVLGIGFLVYRRHSRKKSEAQAV